MREHITDGNDCWCDPEYLLPCDDHGDSKRCWKCEGRNGCAVLTRAEADATDRSIVIVHREER